MIAGAAVTCTAVSRASTVQHRLMVQICSAGGSAIRNSTTMHDGWCSSQMGSAVRVSTAFKFQTPAWTHRDIDY